MSPGTHFQVVEFGADNAEGMKAARHIRQVVFCDEQGVSPAEEWDDKDSQCRHFLLMEGKVPIACARLRPIAVNTFKIERVAVLKGFRGRGAGRAIMHEIISGLGSATLVLNAQIIVEGFYRTLGFASEGEVFMEANIPHVHMVLRR